MYFKPNEFITPLPPVKDKGEDIKRIKEGFNTVSKMKSMKWSSHWTYAEQVTSA